MSKIVPIDRRYRGYMNFFIEDSKTAVLDVGMCYDAPVSIALLKDLLKGRKLDYIMLTHSHYDHAGALTEYRKAFPEARVIASGKTASVFERDGARRVIKELSDAAAEGKSDEEILEIFTDYSYRTYIMPKLGQTLDAFLANARPMLKTMKREFPEYFEKRDAV